MELIVEKKSVYGNQLVYPICNKAKLFASISGNKTLLPEVIESIKKLGYKLTTKQEVLWEATKAGTLTVQKAKTETGALF
mgnify:CR=1 FL=1